MNAAKAEVRHDGDPRIVLTLDAGGTNLKFSAIQRNALLMAPIYVPSEAHDLDRCLENILQGFKKVQALLPEPAAAISFAFPGPADYPAGIIGDLPNLSAFRGGVALGPMLEDAFGIPVFINNDGNLFAYGEAIAGFLPRVNAMLAEAGSPKRFRNLFGVTLGTGLGGGIIIDGRMLIGDNSNGGEAWLLRHKLEPDIYAEEGACIRAVRRAYAQETNTSLEDAPEPKTIADIAYGHVPGDAAAAVRAFRRMGEIVGDVLAQALTLVDGLAVVGGGLAGAYPLFLPSVVAAMNGVYTKSNGDQQSRLVSRAYNAEDPEQSRQFAASHVRTLHVPGTRREVSYDPVIRTAVGISLKTSESVAVGAYAFALQQLDSRE